MSQFEIAVVVGSLRRESFNRKLATGIAKLPPPEFSFKQVQIGDLRSTIKMTMATRLPRSSD
jgi:chromate reductase, NAD(P)H dehydrogenase (quinone)